MQSFYGNGAKSAGGFERDVLMHNEPQSNNLKSPACIKRGFVF
jgi:hypothetical protein